ncbi:MAG: ATP-binding protein, partial [Eubacteriales bacterium]|nr:ATP-binding protein [Eubacteriales bacterium]
MEKHKRARQVLIFTLLCALLFSNLPLVYSVFRHEITGAAEARNGRIDLSRENLASGKIYLEGEWEFYWERFLSTDAEGNGFSDFNISVPAEWSSYTVGGEALPAEGYATYKLTLKDLDYDKPVTVFVPDFGSAYRVFVDGKMTAQSGVLSKNQKDIFTSPKADLYPVILSAVDTHVILIEVATSRFSGLYMTPVLADYEAIKAKHETRDAFRLILFGVAVFSLLSLIALYAFAVKKNLNSLWLPLMVFLIVLRVMLTSEFYSMWQGLLFFNLSYEKTNELMYLSTFALKYLLLFLVEEHCGMKIGKKAKLVFLIYYAVLYLVYLLLPPELYNDGFSVLVPLLTYVLDLYLYIKVYRNRKDLKKFGLPIFFCSILIGVGLAVDSYYINGKIAADMSLALLFTFTICSLIICWVYAMRAADVYDDFARSDSQFKLLQKQLAMQKEYYSTLSGQMNEIREMKHDIRHFVGTMGRLTEEGKIDELKSFIKEYDNKTKTEELPFFCKNIVV